MNEYYVPLFTVDKGLVLYIIYYTCIYLFCQYKLQLQLFINIISFTYNYIFTSTLKIFPEPSNKILFSISIPFNSTIFTPVHTFEIFFTFIL